MGHFRGSSGATIVEGNALALHRLFGVAMQLQRIIAFLKAQAQAGGPTSCIFVRDAEKLVVKAQNFIIWEEPSVFPEAVPVKVGRMNLPRFQAANGHAPALTRPDRQKMIIMGRSMLKP
jgi:hypothetical protein